MLMVYVYVHCMDLVLLQWSWRYVAVAESCQLSTSVLSLSSSQHYHWVPARTACWIVGLPGEENIYCTCIHMYTVLYMYVSYVQCTCTWLYNHSTCTWVGWLGVLSFQLPNILVHVLHVTFIHARLQSMYRHCIMYTCTCTYMCVYT